MKILLTGGSGWIGKKVSNKLRQCGHSVMQLERSKKSGLAPLENLEIVLLSDSNCERQIKEFNPDAVIHLACCYDRCGAILDDIMEANFRLPVWLLRIAGETQCRHFIAIGTSLQPNLNYYTFFKHKFSELGKIYVNQGKISFTELLPESLYDCDEPSDRFLSTCIRCLKENRPLKLPEGHRHRDYVWAGDLVKILYYILSADLSAIAETGKNGCTYSRIPVGCGNAPRIDDFIIMLKEELKSNSELVWGGIPPRPNESDSQADLTNLRAIGYDIASILPWENGVRRLIDNKL